jgi:hypothetical protein
LLAIYVVLKGLYNLAFVWIWHQGYWYFPLSLLISSLLIGVAIQHRVWASPEAGIPGSARPQRSLPYGYLAALGLCGAALVVILLSFHGDRAGWAIVAAVCLSAAILALWGSCRWWIIMALTAWGLFMGTADVLNRSAWKYGDQYARFWADRDRLRREFQASSLASPIVEFDDGIVTYGLSVQGMSGFGLAADGDAVAAKLSGHLLDLAYERGFRTIASLYYAPPVPPEPRPGVSADAIVAQIATMQTENLRKWKFAIVLRDQRTGLLLVRFDPAGAQ